MKHIIWQNTDLTELEADLKKNLEDVYPEMDEEEREEVDVSILAEEYNSEYFNDEIDNLDIPLNGDMLIIADMGLWNGRRSGYKLIENANVNDCLKNGLEDYMDIYSNGFDIVSKASHHDGTNYILFRKVKKNISQNAFEAFLYKIYNQDDSFKQDINKFTMSIAPLVHKVYGWKLEK